MLEKLIKKWHQYVVCNTYSHSNLCEILVAYRIPSQENQAKEGLTLRLKLKHFPTLNKYIYLLDL